MESITQWRSYVWYLPALELVLAEPGIDHRIVLAINDLVNRATKIVLLRYGNGEYFYDGNHDWAFDGK